MLKAEIGNTTVYYTRGFELISRREKTIASYYVYDGGLSVRALTNEAGIVTDTLVFDAFGNETGRTGSSDNPYGFQGEEQDETGLYYLRARYMDPVTGTFTTMDTYGGSLSDPMSLHKYLFANSNPVMYCDPSGHYTLSEQETAIAIQAIIGEAMSGIFYIADWLITDPGSENHSIPMMIVTMMTGLLQGAVMGCGGGLISGLLAKAGMSVLDYILTGIMFTLFSWDLKLAALNMKESGNWLVASLCDAGGDFAGVVAFASLCNGIARAANWIKEKTNRGKPNKKGFVRIGGWNDSGNNPSFDEYKSLWSPTDNPNTLWSKGKLKIHYDNHGAEFGASSSSEYSKMALDFGTKQSADIIQTTYGSYVYRFDPTTNEIFVGTLSSGKIKTYYIWDGRSNDFVINYLKEIGLWN